MSARVPTIAVIDYQGGNLQNVETSLTSKGFQASITADPSDIAAADGLVLPGVGAFFDAMVYMEQSGQAAAIKQAVSQGAPLLGICLGMQVLFEWGDEGVPGSGDIAGLGLLEGRCYRLDSKQAKVPHVGWNTVEFSPWGEVSALYHAIPTNSFFYFTHSYYAKPTHDADITANTRDGQQFASSVERGAVYGVQYHPEKSSSRGLDLMENFGRIVLKAAKERA